jgi:hypothetical protein
LRTMYNKIIQLSTKLLQSGFWFKGFNTSCHTQA